LDKKGENGRRNVRKERFLPGFYCSLFHRIEFDGRKKRAKKHCGMPNNASRDIGYGIHSEF
jgi:hypothetical protein